MANIYKKSGVDIKSGYKVVEDIKLLLKSQKHNSNIKNMSMFAGMYDLSSHQLKNPVLFSATDGVGTKVLLAIKSNKIENIGQDLVAMCVNDLICHGAKPIYFLDYIAINKIYPEQIKTILKSIIDSLNLFDCKLIGGETAEMNRMYQKGEFDLAGFAVGICEKENIIYNNATEINDIVLGIESSGMHSNGYSLIHYLIENKTLDIKKTFPSGIKIIDSLLKPTNIYVNVILELIKKIKVCGLANNTGGGIKENLARALADNTNAIIDINNYPNQELYNYLINDLNLDKKELFDSLNMGIGFFVIIKEKDLKLAQKIINQFNYKCYILGKISKGEKKVILKW